MSDGGSETDFDVVGAGLGPCNLSLAALLEPIADIRARYFEARPEFQWHCGIMVPGAQLQVSYLKDLVTLVDPCNPFSFLNYLSTEGLLYRFLIAHSEVCSRQEFERYYQWAAGRIGGIGWNHEVERVDLKGDALVVTCAGRPSVTTGNLVIGSGQTPALPDFAATLRGDTVMHSAEFRIVRPELARRDVMVVGAGQSGAEVVNHLLGGGEAGMPRSLTWISSRVGFLPMDDSPFSNEWFHPQYVDHFYGLSPERRRVLLDHQRLASDGVSESLLREIYRRLYELDAVRPGTLPRRLLVSRRVTDLLADGARLTAVVRDDDTGEIETHGADVVIFATGYRSEFPRYLEPLRARILDSDGAPRIRRDYSLEWDGPRRLGIYVQNAAESTHGIADPNLSLAAWRSARIINSILGRTVYRTEGTRTTISWNGTEAPDQPTDAASPDTTSPFDTVGVGLP